MTFRLLALVVAAVVAAAVMLLASHRTPTVPQTIVPLRVDTVERSFTIRASRSAVRPLEPPAAPVSQPSAPARPAPQRTPTKPAASPSNRPSTPTDAQWARLRQCESGGNYQADTGNGFYGAYQFTLGTWRSVGGTGNPALAAPAEQDMRAQLLYQRRGAQPWPVCGRYLK